MRKVSFHYDSKIDAWGWTVIAKSKDIWGLKSSKHLPIIPKELLGKIKKSSFSKSCGLLEKYISDDPLKKYKRLIIKEKILSLKKIWDSVEDKYFNVLSDITQKPIFTNNFRCYFTTGFMCPYSEKEDFFLVSMWQNLPESITTICHELMHLQFLHYYRNFLEKKGLNNNQIEDIKESLTFLLNEKEFSEIILCEDKGYPKHQKLRKNLQAMWRKRRNFGKLLEEVIKMI